MDQAQLERMDSIMKVDTGAVLKEIRNIELKLTEHSRHDKLPPWATGFLDRLAHLEQDNIDIRRSIPSMSSDKPVPGVNMQDLSNDDRVLTKLRVELDSQVSATRISLDSQISSMHLEVDRLHKLLAIRPTTSEMQQVQLSVTDMNRKMQLFVDDVAASVKSAVQERIVEEMSSMMAHIKNREAINEEAIMQLTSKMDRSIKDMSVLREAVEVGLEALQSNIDGVQRECGTVKDDLGVLRTTVEEEAAKTEDGFASLKFEVDRSAEEFGEYRVEIAKVLRRIDDTIDKDHADMYSFRLMMDERHKDTTEKIVDVKEELKEFKGQYECDMEGIAEQTQTLNLALDTLTAKYNDTAAYVNSLKDIDGVKLISDHAELLKSHTKAIELCNENILKGDKRTDALILSTKAMDKGLEQLSQNLIEQKARIEQLDINGAHSDERIKKLEGSLKVAHDKIENLLALRDEVSVITELSSAADNRIKSIQVSVKSILEAVDDHDARLETLQLETETTEETVSKKLEEMKGTLVDMLTEKQAEMDASVQNMKDNLEVMSQAGETHKKGANVRGAFMKGVNAFKENSHHAMPDIAGLAMSEEEQRELESHNAKFLADLCINFEEISIRKTYVPEIPPTMCEHITATSQALAALIATCTDAEAVQRVLRASPGEAEYEDATISDKRQQRMDDFVEQVARIATANHAQPGITRMDARERFMKQLKKALTICMSKHDQVLIVGNSRFGRMKIPSCIACDRPLLDKVRRTDTLAKPDDRDGMSRTSLSGPSHSQVLDDDHGTDAMLSFSRSDDGRGKILGALKVPSTASKKSRGGGGSGSKSEEPYVLRAGFKLPRPTTSNVPSGLSVGSSLSTLPQDFRSA